MVRWTHGVLVVCIACDGGPDADASVDTAATDASDSPVPTGADDTEIHTDTDTDVGLDTSLEPGPPPLPLRVDAPVYFDELGSGSQIRGFAGDDTRGYVVLRTSLDEFLVVFDLADPTSWESYAVPDEVPSVNGMLAGSDGRFHVVGVSNLASRVAVWSFDPTDITDQRSFGTVRGFEGTLAEGRTMGGASASTAYVVQSREVDGGAIRIEAMALDLVDGDVDWLITVREDLPDHTVEFGGRSATSVLVDNELDLAWIGTVDNPAFLYAVDLQRGAVAATRRLRDDNDLLWEEVGTDAYLTHKMITSLRRTPGGVVATVFTNPIAEERIRTVITPGVPHRTVEFQYLGTTVAPSSDAEVDPADVVWIDGRTSQLSAHLHGVYMSCHPSLDPCLELRSDAAMAPRFDRILIGLGTTGERGAVAAIHHRMLPEEGVQRVLLGAP